MEHDRFSEFMTLVVSAQRSVTRLKGYYMASYGLGSTHTTCIKKLHESDGGLNRTQLAEYCELDKAQISRIVSELCEKGYTTEEKTGSAYKRKVTLTEEGSRIAQDIDRIILEINTRVSGEIPKEQIEAFYSVFGTICDNLKVAEQTSESKHERK